jgi:hypothetical protein
LLTQIQSPLPPLDDTKNDTNARTAQLVQLISEIGPDIPEISRRLGQFKESVRYRYKQKILKRGLAVQAAVDSEKLGLRHVEMVVDFSKEFKVYAQSILAAMSDICYVTSFEKLFPKGQYFVGADVPEEFVGPFVDFVDGLRRKGLLATTEFHVFDWFRRIPMRAQSYDFDAGRWDFDWTAREKVDLELASYAPSQKTRFDYFDLLLLKELHFDASRSLVEISRKLNENYKALAWHYKTHVIGRELVKCYTIRWPGTKYDSKIDRALHRQHRYFWVNVVVRDLNKVERMELAAKANSLPFLWAEALGKDYFAQFAFPVDFFTEAMQYLEEILAPVSDRAELYMVDQTNALAFTMSYRLYDQQSRRWTFDQPSLEARFDELMLKIREKGG